MKILISGSLLLTQLVSCSVRESSQVKENQPEDGQSKFSRSKDIFGFVELTMDTGAMKKFLLTDILEEKIALESSQVVTEDESLKTLEGKIKILELPFKKELLAESRNIENLSKKSTELLTEYGDNFVQQLKFISENATGSPELVARNAQIVSDFRKSQNDILDLKRAKVGNYLTQNELNDYSAYYEKRTAFLLSKTFKESFPNMALLFMSSFNEEKSFNVSENDAPEFFRTIKEIFMTQGKRISEYSLKTRYYESLLKVMDNESVQPLVLKHKIKVMDLANQWVFREFLVNFINDQAVKTKFLKGPPAYGRAFLKDYKVCVFMKNDETLVLHVPVEKGHNECITKEFKGFAKDLFLAKNINECNPIPSFQECSY